ncbi:GAF domain-containing protein [Caulobacter sp. S45]|uniref:GAF domain-containing protein n=1 Tax=Caulobacter sp. S45 TaxID=1641861 RepID=UPI00157592CF|nr:GAF domain-containing protein [Caulobacter sp. S45]
MSAPQSALLPAAAKCSLYRQALEQIASVLDGEPDRTARMATVAAMLTETLRQAFWVGFYVVDPRRSEELVVGPYQGTLGCLRIPFSRGVCGAAARTGATQIVPDVHAFPGHIACDSRSNSEIVVPVLDETGALIAVLDLDSTSYSAFDGVDAAGLEAIVEAVFARLSSV